MTILRDIRRRLRSIENLKKITDAMERVSAARLRRAQVKAEQSRPYIRKMKEMVENLASVDVEKHPLFTPRGEVKKVGLIVVTGDKGLAGSYNNNVLIAADQFLDKHDKNIVELILLGRKAVDHYKRHPSKISFQLEHWTGKITFEEIRAFSEQIVNWYLEERLDEIWLIYTQFHSMSRREVRVEKFLNIEKPAEDKKSSYQSFIFEPNATAILEELLPRYCMTRLQGALQESYASELSARIIAMQQASKNSEEIIEEMTLIRNKIRQEGITKEMIEIVSGAEAEK